MEGKERHGDRELKRKKAAAGFAVFLLLMWLCTLVSKSIYASKLPQVTTAAAEKKGIEHLVEADGIMKQGSDVAVHTLSGLRVERIFVKAGDTVKADTVLFKLEEEDLKEAITEKELEAAKLEYQISDLQKNRELSEEDKEKAQRRADEDYRQSDARTGTDVGRADAALEQAENKLGKHSGKEPGITSEEDRKRAYKEYDQWLEEQKNGGSTVSGNIVEKPDFSQEDSKRSAWEETKGALEAAVQNACYGQEDAASERKEALTDKQRKIEDSMAGQQADSTLEINRLQLLQLKTELKEYKELYEQQGNIRSGRDGMVTKVNLTAGEKTPEGAAVVCADMEVPYQFEATLTKAQKKYVNQGDEITLKTAKGNEELYIDYLAEEENSPGTYRAVVYLPEGTGSVGMSGTLKKSQVSERFECCIPVEALHSDANGGRTYVYVVGEREGILGRERYAQIRYVKVLDQNAAYAALETGVIDKEDEIITGSDKEIENNSIIRYRED